jgi:arylsulfatase A-like enzyme
MTYSIWSKPLNGKSFGLSTILFLTLYIGFFGTSACTEEPKQTANQNVLILCLDTLRVDHVGAYGYERDTTPNIDRIADNGSKFLKAYAPSGWTVPSTHSMLTSLNPSEHGAGVAGEIKFLDEGNVTDVHENVTSIAQMLKGKGFRTGLFSANPYLRGRIQRGFDYAVALRQDAGKLTDKVVDWLQDDLSEPFFAHIQYIDVHFPIEPPEKYARMYRPEEPLPEKYNPSMWAFRKLTDRSDPDFQLFKKHKIAIYDGALRYIDDQIGRILELLESNELLDNTLIVVTSDHGEEFWDHAEIGREMGGDPRKIWGIGHGQSLFQELLHVPLIFSGPGIQKQVNECPSGLIDLPPTILEYLKLPVPSFMRGRVLPVTVDADPGPCPENPYIGQGIAYGPDARSIIWRGMKMINRADGITLLYDLNTDPEERVNLADSRPEVIMKLDQLYTQTVTESQTPSESLKMDEDALKQLRDLGYLN